MKLPSYAKPVLIALAAVAALGLLRYQPWERGKTAAGPAAPGEGRAVLQVGFLPVT